MTTRRTAAPLRATNSPPERKIRADFVLDGSAVQKPTSIDT